MQFSLRALGYFFYTNTNKLRQIPDVISDYAPKFISDETLRPADGDVYAIVVNYSKFGTPGDLVELLVALRKARVNTIVVCNGEPKPGDLAQLRSEAHRILIRRNIGRDIGAYRAATLYLTDRGLPASRVLYFNDSIIYLAGPRLDAMIARFVTSSYPVTGAFENHEMEHHLGSFAFAIDGEVFRNPRLLAFWRGYRPFDLRPHAIHKGEMGLTKALKKCAIDIEIVFSADILSEKILALEFDEILNLIPYTSWLWRRKFFAAAQASSHGLRTKLAKELSASIRAPGRFERSERSSNLAGEDPAPGGRRRQADAPAGQPDITGVEAAFRTLSKMELVDGLLEGATAQSQIHYGFGLFYRLMDVPIIKKDLLQRDIYKEHDCNLVLGDLPEDVRRRVMRQLINRGRPVYVTGMKRFKIRQGLE